MKTYKQCERCKYIFELKYFTFWADPLLSFPGIALSYGTYSKICKECAKKVGEEAEKNWEKKK